MPRTWVGQPTATALAADDLLYGQKTSAGTPATKEQKFTRAAVRDALIVDKTRTLYVGKHGNDSNDGKTLEKAFLTFGAALTAAALLTPTEAAPVAILCEDAGVYTEDITGVAHVSIYAPGATLIPATDAGSNIKNCNTWVFRKITRKHTGITMDSGGKANVIVQECGTEATPTNGQWLFLVDARAGKTGGLLEVRMGKYVGECCVGAVYIATLNNAILNIEAESIQTTADGTATWWDFFCEVANTGVRGEINIECALFNRAEDSNGAFRAWPANPGVDARINVRGNDYAAPSSTLLAVERPGSTATGGQINASIERARATTLAHVEAAGSSVHAFIADPPSTITLTGVTSQIEILTPNLYKGPAFTVDGLLDVDDDTQATAPTDGSIHTKGGLGVEKAAQIGGKALVKGDIEHNNGTYQALAQLGATYVMTYGTVSPPSVANIWGMDKTHFYIYQPLELSSALKLAYKDAIDLSGGNYIIGRAFGVAEITTAHVTNQLRLWSTAVKGDRIEVLNSDAATDAIVADSGGTPIATLVKGGGGATFIYNGIAWEVLSFLGTQLPSYDDNSETLIRGVWWQDPNNLADYYPVYEKRVPLGAMPNATTKDVAHGISNAHVDSIRVTGTMDDTSASWSLPWPDTVAGWAVELIYLNATYLRITTANNYATLTGFAKVRYSKTTDTARTKTQTYAETLTGK